MRTFVAMIVARSAFFFGLVTVLVPAASAFCQTAPSNTQYLVEATGGPGFTSPAETMTVLEKGILPGFEYLLKLQADKKILAGGLPVGDRSFVFIIEAASNDEADRLVRSIPFWGALQWKVTPLQSFAGRADTERAILKTLKEGAH
jgi:hypothetical protein